MNLALLLGVVAAFLVGLGIYGVVSQAVIQRTSEFGVRIALGADGGTIQRLVLGQGLRPVVAGMVVGIVAAIAIGRLLRTLLFGVSPTDVVPFILGSLFLVSVAAFGCLIPAWRASRMDPLVALRYQ